MYFRKTAILEGKFGGLMGKTPRLNYAENTAVSKGLLFSHPARQWFYYKRLYSNSLASGLQREQEQRTAARSQGTSRARVGLCSWTGMRKGRVIQSELQ